MTIDQTRKYKTLAELARHIIKTNSSIHTVDKACAEARKMIPKEQKFQDAIIKHLKKKYPQAYIWKDQAGMYQQRGIPDICAIINGRFYGFEVKRPFFGRASKLQEKNIERINRAGGIAGVVTYTEDVDALIERGART